jgi:hypothetical protein
MGKRLADADQRRFFDEFERVRVSRFRASGVIDPSRAEALIPFPNGKTKLIATRHTRFPSGGGWSYFVCPGCSNRRATLYLIGDAPRCARCCDALNIKHRAIYGFGRTERRQASDRHLDALIAKLDTTEPLPLKPAPLSWSRKARTIYRSQRLTERRQRAMISLRLNQLACQQASSDHRAVIKHLEPIAAARSLIDVRSIWRANTSERLQQALDKAQTIIIEALDSPDPAIRAAAGKLMLRTKAARDRGIV